MDRLTRVSRGVGIGSLYLNKNGNTVIWVEGKYAYYVVGYWIHSSPSVFDRYAKIHDATNYLLGWKMIPISDLPLYVSWQYKSTLYERLLQGGL